MSDSYLIALWAIVIINIVAFVLNLIALLLRIRDY